jgi:acetolactate synthase-1/2/3 large subunit
VPQLDTTISQGLWRALAEYIVRLAESFGGKGMMIRQPEELATTLKWALEMAGPVVVGIPVDYRDNHRLMEIVHPSALN